MKKSILSSIIVALFSLCIPAVHAGEKTVGVTAGYNTRNDCAVAGLFFRYQMSSLFRIAPDVTYLFKNKDVDGLSINCNVQMPLHVIPRVKLYPLAGINYTSWNYHYKDIPVDNDDVTTRKNKLGLNVGAGLDINVTSTLRLFVEGKYTGVRHYSSGTISAGIGYSF